MLCAVLYGVLAAPLREKESVPFEKLLGTDHALFRMTAVIAGLLLIAGSAGYLSNVNYSPILAVRRIY